jgi:hypothetical protein
MSILKAKTNIEKIYSKNHKISKILLNHKSFGKDK